MVDVCLGGSSVAGDGSVPEGDFSFGNVRFPFQNDLASHKEPFLVPVLGKCQKYSADKALFRIHIKIGFPAEADPLPAEGKVKGEAAARQHGCKVFALGFYVVSKSFFEKSLLANGW